MVRELADWNPVRSQAVKRWPLREALLAYVHRLKRAAEADYRHQLLMWACIAPLAGKKIAPPAAPAILKGET